MRTGKTDCTNDRHLCTKISSDAEFLTVFTHQTKKSDPIRNTLTAKQNFDQCTEVTVPMAATGRIPKSRKTHSFKMALLRKRMRIFVEVFCVFKKC